MEQLLKQAILGKNFSKKVPVWFMRQAGRYLPEYMNIKAEFKDFISMCYDSDAATKITMMPIDRFDLDAAIIFSDILVVLKEMGAEIKFTSDTGPTVSFNGSIDDFLQYNTYIDEKTFLDGLNPVFQTIKKTRSKLSKDKSLIGFSGAPLTLSCYFFKNTDKLDFNKIKRFLNENRNLFTKLIYSITDRVISYCIEQINSGVDVIQIFDSHCSFFSERDFYDFSILPTKKIIDSIKKHKKDALIIAFPMGAGVKYVEYVKQNKTDCISVDHYTPIVWAKNNLQNLVSIQGNLDPIVMAVDIESSIKETEKILNTVDKNNFIFNVGHGILPFTNINNVENIIKYIRSKN